MPKKRNNELNPGDKVTVVREVVEVRKTKTSVTVLWDDGSQTPMPNGVEVETTGDPSITRPPMAPASPPGQGQTQNPAVP